MRLDSSQDYLIVVNDPARPVLAYFTPDQADPCPLERGNYTVPAHVAEVAITSGRARLWTPEGKGWRPTGKSLSQPPFAS